MVPTTAPAFLDSISSTSDRHGGVCVICIYIPLHAARIRAMAMEVLFLYTVFPIPDWWCSVIVERPNLLLPSNRYGWSGFIGKWVVFCVVGVSWS